MFASRLSDDVEIVSTSGRQKYRGHSSCRGSPTAVRCLLAILSYPSNLISMASLHAPTQQSGLILLTINFGPFGTRVIFGKAQAHITIGPLSRCVLHPNIGLAQHYLTLLLYESVAFTMGIKLSST